MPGPVRFLRNLFSSDKDRRLAATAMVVKSIMGRYPMTWHQIDWFHDPDFIAFLEWFGEVDGFNSHRRWMVWQLVRLTSQVEGDTAECGVYMGAGSWLICAANTQRTGEYTHHLFDSFEGLSAPDSNDGTYWKQGSLAVHEEVVGANLAPFAARLRFHKGWIPERFPEVQSRRFSFVHIDVDLYQPTLDSLSFFYDKMSTGGVIVCDDYACASCPGATKAVDEFLADKPEKMLRLDGGGGFLIKGTATAADLSAMAEQPQRLGR